MIERLLEIKKIRADRADKAVQRQEYRVANVAAELQKAERSVADYHVWRQEEEERRFAKAKQQTVLLKELETLRQEIALLREREAELKQRVAEVKVTLEQERTLLKQNNKRPFKPIKPKKIRSVATTRNRGTIAPTTVPRRTRARRVSHCRYYLKVHHAH